jgi:predicted metal-binding membrane protein
MFPLGMMNVAALASITLVVFVEKTLPWGATLAQAAGVLLLAYGLLVIMSPPTLQIFQS